jgi:hypothetical protein
MSDAAMVRLRDGAGLWTAVSGTGPPGAAVNAAANRKLWNDRETEDLRLAAARPVTMIFGADDPRPWTASDSALPNASRILLEGAGAGAGLRLITSGRRKRPARGDQGAASVCRDGR